MRLEHEGDFLSTNIGDIMHNFIRSAGYTNLSELQRDSGITSATLSRIVNDKQRPTPKTLKKIAPWLKVSYEELMQVSGYIDLPETPTLAKQPSLSSFSKKLSLKEDSSYPTIDLNDILDNEEIKLSNNGIPITESDIANIKASLNKITIKDNISTKSIPILGTIRKGLPILSEDNYVGYLQIPEDIKADFALKVKGDSMLGVGIHDGDFALCRQMQEAKSGDIVVAIQDELRESIPLLRFLFYNNSKKRLMLQAANPSYQNIYKVHICGIMVAQIRKEPPPYSVYLDFIVTKYAEYGDWLAIIEIANQCGINPKQARILIEYHMKFLQVCIDGEDTQ
jgi:repressor LexA